MKYSFAIWNIQWPYLHCLCKDDAWNGCKGDIMWLDHAIWYMINHLNMFFENDSFSMLKTKFVAFLVWIHNVVLTNICQQFTFCHLQDLMIEAAVQFATDLDANSFANCPKGAEIGKIEQLLKPTSFSATNPGTTNNAYTYKRAHTINYNIRPLHHISIWQNAHLATTGNRNKVAKDTIGTSALPHHIHHVERKHYSRRA